ncbi:MAG: CPBP family intramembrane metalloprotease [Hyphomonadaceae bacterium]|nr:CPBP family intramembrane metalloprotease [Hyphomonadaceae bacterium]
MLGPYQTPMALVREPLMSFFWVILAPVLFLTGGALIAQEIIPPFQPGSPEELQAYQTSWLFACLSMAAWFAIMSLWSEKLGAGPFAGRMTTTSNWILIGAIIGPLLLILPSLVVSSIMTEEGWQYREEINEAVFAPENWTIAYIFVAVIMAPVVEEVAFRGIALGAIIARGLSPVAAVTISSLAFAFSHLQYSPAAMFVVFLSGIGFAVLRLMSGTVIVPIIAHMTANANVLLLNWVAANPPT